MDSAGPSLVYGCFLDECPRTRVLLSFLIAGLKTLPDELCALFSKKSFFASLELLDHSSFFTEHSLLYDTKNPGRAKLPGNLSFRPGVRRFRAETPSETGTFRALFNLGNGSGKRGSSNSSFAESLLSYDIISLSRTGGDVKCGITVFRRSRARARGC